MYHPNQSLPSGPPPRPPPPPPPPEPRQSKVISQRGYREKEVDGFNMLRNVIKTITGEELRTRQEILRKGCSSYGILWMTTDIFVWEATDLLLYYPEIGKQSMGQASNLAAFEAPNSIPGPEDTTLAQSSYYSSQPSHWSQTWQSDTEFGAATPYHRTHFHDQQSHFTSTMDSTFNQSSSSGYGEGFSDYYSKSPTTFSGNTLHSWNKWGKPARLLDYLC
ncbi:hypothetical protein EV363DRAFT_1156887 [Boletus edulis]|nr:hypothetical protein EV363DRAFT_1156887 [Boletus edulis]